MAGLLRGSDRTVIEVALRTPVAVAAVEAMRKGFAGIAIVGIGTLTRARDFRGRRPSRRAIRRGHRG